MVKLTKRNHYNPCFWAALWSPSYYRLFLAGMDQPGSVRTQLVHALSAKSGQLFPTTVENIHYDKNLGIAEISREAAEDFARRHHPDRYEEFVRANARATYPVFIDLEQILSELERLPPYRVLLKVAQSGHIESPEERGYLACFLVLQLLRSHAIMKSMIQWHEEVERQKFEHFVTLKWLLGDQQALLGLVLPFAACRWTLFSAVTDALPLCDSPVLVRPQSVLVALSPRLLLQAHLQAPAREDEPVAVLPLSDPVMEEFRLRTIGNTFREIIGDLGVLESWQASSEFQARVALVKDVKRYNRLVRAEGSKELWHVNAYGNRG